LTVLISTVGYAALVKRVAHLVRPQLRQYGRAFARAFVFRTMSLDGHRNLRVVLQECGLSTDRQAG